MLYQKMLFLLKENLKNASTSCNRALAKYNASSLSEVDYSCKIISHWIFDLAFFSQRVHDCLVFQNTLKIHIL